MKLFIVFLFTVIPTVCFGLTCHDCQGSLDRAVDANVKCGNNPSEPKLCNQNGTLYCVKGETTQTATTQAGKVQSIRTSSRGCMTKASIKTALAKYDKKFTGSGCYNINDDGKKNNNNIALTMNACFCDTDKCNGAQANTPSHVGWFIFITSFLTLVSMMSYGSPWNTKPNPINYQKEDGCKNYVKRLYR